MFWCEGIASEELCRRLRGWGEIHAPQAGADGIVRLLPLADDTTDFAAGLPRVPLKKLVFPPQQRLWELRQDRLSPASAGARRVVLGCAPCDLQALAYLDRVFAEDEPYLQLRRQLLVVGGEWQTDDDRCSPHGMSSLAFDLFVAGPRVWGGSARGVALLRELPSHRQGNAPFAFATSGSRWCDAPTQETLIAAHQRRFATPFWNDHARFCLSCGACSVVCPTCYCYEAGDEAGLDGTTRRLRRWDNCFFREHGLVAGGHNFRPDRGSRLRFRFEHKFLGFGDLRGESSCVACGRCRAVCPVGIDLRAVVDALLEGG